MINFDMKVDAKYYVLADDALKAFELYLAKEETDELYKILQNNTDTRQTQGIDYLANNFKAEERVMKIR